MDLVDNSNHICLICNKTIVGLLQYVEHFRTHAIPDKTHHENTKILSPSQVKREGSESTISHEWSEIQSSESTSKPNFVIPVTQAGNVAKLYPEDDSSFSTLPSRDLQEADGHSFSVPKDSVDFFQSLELKSTNNEGLPKQKLKASQRLSILEDDLHAETLLPITSILSNLDFSSDEESIDCSDNEIGRVEGALSDEERDAYSSANPPQSHTGGKWKPGQGPGMRRAPIAGKWKPGQGPAPASHKNIMKKKLKLRGPMANAGKEFQCNICNEIFLDRSTFSVHFGQEKHKAAVAERRLTKKKISAEEAKNGMTARANFQDKLSAPLVDIKVSSGNESSVKGEQYYCPVCDLFFSCPTVFQTHCDTKGHKDNLEKQGSKEYESSVEVMRTDASNDTVYTDQETKRLFHNKNIKAKEPVVEEKHECLICRKVFKRKYEMARHLLTRMHRVRAESKPLDEWVDILEKYNKYMMRLSLFQCGICQFYFNRQRDFLDHMCSPKHVRNCEDMLGPIMCVACRFKTHKHSEMMQHFHLVEHLAAVEKNHGVCIIRESHTKITCKFCGIKMHSAARIKRHCELRHADRLCDIQETIDVRPVEYNQYKCPMCSKSFKGKSMQQLHFLRVHKNSSVFKCEVCNRGFLDQRRLDDHLRTRFHAKRVIASNLKEPMKSEAVKQPKRKSGDANSQTFKDVCSQLNSIEKDGDKEENPSLNTLKGKRPEITSDSVEITEGDERRRSARRRKTNKLDQYDYSDLDGAGDLIVKEGVSKKKKLKIKLCEKSGELVSNFIPDSENNGNGEGGGQQGTFASFPVSESNAICKDSSQRKGQKEETDPVALEQASRNVFSCVYCDFSATDLLELRDHYNESHPNDILSCQPCNQHFLSVKAYKIHCAGRGHQLKLRELSGETTLHKCPHCDKGFLQESLCALHVETMHRHPSCEADLQHVRKGSDLVTQLYGDHVAQVEQLSNDSSVSCPECGKFVRKDTLVEHLRQHTGEKPYVCRFCAKSFAGRLTLRRHISVHLNMPLFICDLCGKEFKRNSQLLQHMRQHDYEKKGEKHVCQVCKLSYNNPEDLSRHMRRHGDRTYSCTWPGCKWTFVLATELKSHMHTHTRERKYLCDICGYGAPTKTRLKRHARIHDQHRAFVCEYCPYKATCKTHLRRHMRIHINSKPYSCPYCDYTCNTHENIRKHILKTQKHKGLKLYPCKLCADFGCDSSKEIRNHLMTVHADYMQENCVDSLALFSGLYKREEDYKKPKEGAEILQVTKGRFYRSYQNPGSAPLSRKPKTKKSKKENTKMTVVIMSPEEIEAPVLQQPQQHVPASQSQEELQTFVPSGQSVIINPSCQEEMIVTEIQQQQLELEKSLPDPLQQHQPTHLLQKLDNGNLEMVVGEDSTLPRYVEVSNMVIHDAFSNNTHQIIPVSYTVSSQEEQHLQQLPPTSISISSDQKLLWTVGHVDSQTLTVDDNNIPSAANAEPWYSGIPQVHNPNEVIEQFASIEPQPDSQNEAAFLQGKYFNVSTAQIYNATGENRVVVLDQTASDM